MMYETGLCIVKKSVQKGLINSRVSIDLSEVCDKAGKRLIGLFPEPTLAP